MIAPIFAIVFIIFGAMTVARAQAEPAESPKPSGTYTQDLGFRVGSSEIGDLNIKVFTYLRYLNQTNLDSNYTNYFGTTSKVQRRQDLQVNKELVYFLGWIMDPKLRYLTYVWSTNSAQGESAQVVVAGNLNYNFNENFTLGGGIASLPGTRSLEGNFPRWFSVDSRTIADEFFRPSYTTGIWATGAIIPGLTYNVMLGNNLSQLGISASQLDNSLNTLSAALVWMPTTGEFGKAGGFGDFDEHRNAATRIGLHFTRSDEDRQNQPTSDTFDNVQIRLSDGSVIFVPDLFGAGITVNDVLYQMASLDFGIKQNGKSLDLEYYQRRLSDFSGPGASGLDAIDDEGFQIQASTMLQEKFLQIYIAYSKILGKYGNPSDSKLGVNLYPWKNEIARLNFEYIYLENSPVGGASLPYPVGGNGSILNASFVLKM